MDGRVVDPGEEVGAALPAGGEHRAGIRFDSEECGMTADGGGDACAAAGHGGTEERFALPDPALVSGTADG